MTRPRAADDFAAIRARLEELCRESGQVPAEPDAQPTGARPYPPASSEAKHAAPRRLPPAIRRTLSGN
jgi:hypothetical protein